MDADFLQRFVVLAGDVLAEDQIRVCLAMQPAVMLDLVFQLTRSPAGITQRQESFARSFSSRDRLQDVERRGEADTFVDRQCRVLDVEVVRMQHETALSVHRPALEYFHASGTGGKLNEVRRRNYFKLHEK